MVTIGGRDRGQLLLAGSVAIAVAILGVTVLLNAAMYTDATTPADRPRTTVATAETYERTVEVDLRRLVEESGSEAALRRNVTTYDERMGRVAARSASASLHVRLVEATPSAFAFEFTFVTPELTYRSTISIPRGDG